MSIFMPSASRTSADLHKLEDPTTTNAAKAKIYAKYFFAGAADAAVGIAKASVIVVGTIVIAGAVLKAIAPSDTTIEE